MMADNSESESDSCSVSSLTSYSSSETDQDVSLLSSLETDTEEEEETEEEEKENEDQKKDKKRVRPIKSFWPQLVSYFYQAMGSNDQPTVTQDIETNEGAPSSVQETKPTSTVSSNITSTEDEDSPSFIVSADGASTLVRPRYRNAKSSRGALEKSLTSPKNAQFLSLLSCLKEYPEIASTFTASTSSAPGIITIPMLSIAMNFLSNELKKDLTLNDLQDINDEFGDSYGNSGGNEHQSTCERLTSASSNENSTQKTSDSREENLQVDDSSSTEIPSEPNSDALDSIDENGSENRRSESLEEKQIVSVQSLLTETSSVTKSDEQSSTEEFSDSASLVTENLTESETSKLIIQEEPSICSQLPIENTSSETERNSMDESRTENEDSKLQARENMVVDIQPSVSETASLIPNLCSDEKLFENKESESSVQEDFLTGDPLSLVIKSNSEDLIILLNEELDEGTNLGSKQDLVTDLQPLVPEELIIGHSCNPKHIEEMYTQADNQQSDKEAVDQVCYVGTEVSLVELGIDGRTDCLTGQDPSDNPVNTIAKPPQCVKSFQEDITSAKPRNVQQREDRCNEYETRETPQFQKEDQSERSFHLTVDNDYGIWLSRNIPEEILTIDEPHMPLQFSVKIQSTNLANHVYLPKFVYDGLYDIQRHVSKSCNLHFKPKGIIEKIFCAISNRSPLKVYPIPVNASFASIATSMLFRLEDVPVTAAHDDVLFYYLCLLWKMNHPVINMALKVFENSPYKNIVRQAYIPPHLRNRSSLEEQKNTIYYYIADVVYFFSLLNPPIKSNDTFAEARNKVRARHHAFLKKLCSSFDVTLGEGMSERGNDWAIVKEFFEACPQFSQIIAEAFTNPEATVFSSKYVDLFIVQEILNSWQWNGLDDFFLCYQFAVIPDTAAHSIPAISKQCEEVKIRYNELVASVGSRRLVPFAGVLVPRSLLARLDVENFPELYYAAKSKTMKEKDEDSEWKHFGSTRLGMMDCNLIDRMLVPQRSSEGQGQQEKIIEEIREPLHKFASEDGRGSADEGQHRSATEDQDGFEFIEIYHKSQ